MRDRRSVAGVGVATLAIVGFLGLGYLVLAVAPDLFANTRGLNPTAHADERQSVRTSALTLLAGVIAVIGAVYTARSFALNRSGQITERFSRAIEQLGKDELELRLGAIYSLERIARDSATDHGPVMEVLTAYVRMHARWTAGALEHATPGTDPQNWRKVGFPSYVPPRLPADIEAVMAVLVRRNTQHEGPGNSLELDLSGTDLRGAKLQGADLRRIKLRESNLQESQLVGARLTGADLSFVRLEEACLDDVDLEGATLLRASLVHASLKRANLRGAEARWARFSAAQFGGAHLDYANFRGAHIDQARFRSLVGREIASGLETANFFKVVGEASWPTGFDYTAALKVNKRDDRAWLQHFRRWHPEARGQAKSIGASDTE